ISLIAPAQAHTHLKAAVPADGSTVQASPEHIVLTFSEPARLTALTLQREGEKEQKLAPLPSVAAAQVTVPVPNLSAGRYVVTWRIVGADSHIMSGTLHFTVGATRP